MMTEEAGGSEIIATILAALGDQLAAVETCEIEVAAAAHMPDEEVAVAGLAAIDTLVVIPGTTIGGMTTAGMTIVGVMTADLTTAGAMGTKAGNWTTAATEGIQQRLPAVADLRGLVHLRRAGGAAAIQVRAPIAGLKVPQTIQRPRGLWLLRGWKV